MLIPDWPAPSNVKTYQTTRQVGVEIEDHPPLWLKQVHGNQVIDMGAAVRKYEQDCAPPPALRATSPRKGGRELAETYEADACFSTKSQIVCAVQTADCLPILLCDRRGTVVAAIHGGWKSVLAGIIEVTVAALPVNSKELLAWFGPAIGPSKFEVGKDVYDLFVTYDEESASCFTPHKTGKWLANLYQLARQRLFNCGIENVYGGRYCTYSQEDLFFSYRRDGGQTGRMASLIWLE